MTEEQGGAHRGLWPRAGWSHGGRAAVHGALALHEYEHLKCAAYTVLRARAQHDGDIETVRMCDDLLPKEQAMAQNRP